jgi:hypothetical protein
MIVRTVYTGLSMRAQIFICFLLLVHAFHWTAVRCDAQERQDESSHAAQTPSTQRAVSTGGAHSAVLDAEHRPITAGGLVDSGPMVFQNMAQKSRLDKLPTPDGHARKTVHH